jgi:Protein kinase domain/Ricin-type beta-trefoil lectin domain
MAAARPGRHSTVSPLRYGQAGPPAPPCQLEIMTQPSDPARLETLPPTAAAGPTRRTPLGSGYLLERPIGEGSTGRVWRGVRRADGSAVAIKIMHAEYALDPTMVARFRRESMAVRELRHPHLVPVDDLVVVDDTVAIVMELVNGDDLRRIIQRGGLDTRRSVSLLAQVARALAYVHGAGVLHRDVKPENILVTRQAGRPWALLSDFGLAWVAGARQLTRSTQLLGTPAYLAPELLAGRPYGPAVDVYALGVTGYELLAGRRPFDGEHPLAVMRAHLDDEAPRPPGMARDLWRVLRSCLAKRPEDRPSAADVARQLDSLARRRRVLAGAAHGSRLRWPKRRLVVTTGILACGLAAVPVAWWLGPAQAGRPHRAPARTSAAPAASPHLAAVPPSSAPASPSPPPTVLPLTPAVGEILGSDGSCLDDQSVLTANGNPVQSWPCNNTAAQLWTVGADGTLRVVSRCLQGGTGGTVRIWSCDGTTSEQWQLRVGGGLVNVATGTCLDSTGGLGAKPTLRACTGSARQRWKLP